MSLRARVLAGLGVVALVLLGLGVVVVRSTERHLVAQVDERLRTTFNPLGGNGGNGDGGPGFGGGPGGFGPGGEGGPVTGRPRFSDLYVAAVRRDGSVVVNQEPDFAEDTPLPVLDTDAVLAAADGSVATVLAEDGELRYRVFVRGFDRLEAKVVYALPLGDVDEAVRRLVAIQGLATVGALAALGLVGWWVVRLGVRPIKQMTATATALAGGDLSARVPEGPAGTEAAELGSALNVMLDQRARSDERLRRFVADASHELRTPVTTIRGYAELYRKGGLDDGTELAEAMRRTEQEAVRMGTLVDDLLQLARLDGGRPLERTVVDLAVVADDAARDARAVDQERTVRVEVPPVGMATVEGEDARLRQVVANVVGNALVHTPSTAALTVRVGVDATGSTAWLEVADDGPGMSTEAAARAFERFYREDPSRSRHRGGSGLGLSIVEATVAAHGGTVRLTSEPGRGTTVRIELPKAGAPKSGRS